MTLADLEHWEAAYRRFETPEQEIRKFKNRLIRLGARSWPRDSQIVELFCGRANGLRALQGLGFTRLEGMDLSAPLARSYDGNARVYVGDCRHLPFGDESRDILIVQGGLHHLLLLPEDLDRTLAEARRVLRRNGRLVFVEPWQTPFLQFVHRVSETQILRKISNKLDAFAVMTHYERSTYERWLSQPKMILSLVGKHFGFNLHWIRWGKIYFTGSPLPR